MSIKQVCEIDSMYIEKENISVSPPQLCADPLRSFPAKARAIAIPVDLDSQVNTLSLKVHTTMVQRAAKDWRISARTRPRKEPLGGPDYKNIIEKLQVRWCLNQQ